MTPVAVRGSAPCRRAHAGSSVGIVTTQTARPVQDSASARPATRIGWLAIVLTAIAIAVYAVLPYVTASLPVLAEDGVGLAGNYADRPVAIQVAFYAHILGGAVALLVGPFQFWRGLREWLPRVHRWSGRVYLAAVAIGAVAGLILAPASQAGFVGLFGFGALGVLWLVTGWRAYAAIRRGDVPAHRSWMMRNFALTYAAVTLRIWLPLMLIPQLYAGTEFDAAFANAYAAVPFLCWLPNLIVAEWLIRRRGLPSYRLAA